MTLDKANLDEMDVQNATAYLQRSYIYVNEDEADTNLVGFLDDLWPADVIRVRYKVICEDELANGFNVQFGDRDAGSAGIVWRDHSGDGSQPEEIRSRVDGTFTFVGRETLGGTSPPGRFDMDIQHDGNGGFSFQAAVRAWKIKTDPASKLDSPSNANYAGSGASTVEGFDP